MRRTIATATTPGRWRRRRTARIAVAVALVVAAPFVGRSDGDASHLAGEAPPGSAGASATSASGSDGASLPPGSPGSGPSASGSDSSDPSSSDASARASGHEAMRVVPVPLADPSVADVLGPGDLVDLVAVADPSHDPGTPSSGGPGGDVPGDVPGGGPVGGPVLVARAAQVRDIPAGRPGARSILVEVPESAAPNLAATAATTPLAVIVHG